VVGLSAYFMGKQGGSNAALLPELFIFGFRLTIQHFNQKSPREEVFAEGNYFLTVILFKSTFRSKLFSPACPNQHYNLISNLLEKVMERGVQKKPT